MYIRFKPSESGWKNSFFSELFSLRHEFFLLMNENISVCFRILFKASVNELKMEFRSIKMLKVTGSFSFNELPVAATLKKLLMVNGIAKRFLFCKHESEEFFFFRQDQSLECFIHSVDDNRDWQLAEAINAFVKLFSYRFPQTRRRMENSTKVSMNGPLKGN